MGDLVNWVGENWTILYIAYISGVALTVGVAARCEIYHWRVVVIGLFWPIALPLLLLTWPVRRGLRWWGDRREAKREYAERARRASGVIFEPLKMPPMLQVELENFGKPNPRDDHQVDALRYALGGIGHGLFGPPKGFAGVYPRDLDKMCLPDAEELEPDRSRAQRIPMGGAPEKPVTRAEFEKLAGKVKGLEMIEWERRNPNPSTCFGDGFVKVPESRQPGKRVRFEQQVTCPVCREDYVWVSEVKHPPDPGCPMCRRRSRLDAEMCRQL